MADTRDSRDDQALNVDRRQQERAMREELAQFRGAEHHEDLSATLDGLDYPAPAEAVAEALAGHTVDAADTTLPAAEVVERSARATFESTADVRTRLSRPTVAAAMRRLEAASRETDLRAAFREREAAYQRTFRALESIDELDDDEGIPVVAAWIMSETYGNGRFPKSRGVRKYAATYCRDNGYKVRDDDWLGA
jgi:hypothetical protein